MSENKYRDYLTDDRTFYRQYLNPDEEPVGSSSFTKIITGTMAMVGVALGLRHAYQKGALKKQMEFLIDALGSYRETKVGSYSKGLEDWLSADRVNSALEQKGLLRKGVSMHGALSDLPKHIRAREIDREFRNARMQKSPIIPDKKFELIDYIKQYESVMREYKKGERGGGFDEKRAFLRFKELAQEEMDKAFHKLLAFNKKEQELMLQRTGYRQATVRDVWDYLGEHEKKMLQEFEKKLAGRKASYSVMDKIIDKNILVKVDADGRIQRFADLRDYKSAMHRLLKTATDDFTIPFIKINPLRMFYVHKLIKDETPIVFADLSKSRVQPFITKNGVPFLSNYSVYVNGRVFTAKATWDEEKKQIGEVFLKEFDKPGLLIDLKKDADKSLLARQTRNMMNLYDSEHMKVEYIDSDNWFKKYIVKPISKALDLGYQNEPIGHNPEIGDPLSYASGIARWIHNKLKPYKEVRVEGNPFGDYAEWLFVPRHQTIEEIQKRGGSVKDYFAQFYAARNSPEDVTTTSFFFYTFAERLNATLNQVGLGLSAKHLGSAPQILSNLTTKRILPVLLTVEGFKYSNYLYEQYAGDEYEDQLANMFVNAQFFMADVFENLGLTEKFKDAKDLFVGYNFITELPVPVLTTEGLTPIQLGDLLPLDKTREELEEYYETGKEPVRKGRYWQTGNTPFIGSKIEYWRANWFQRITSDWQYTDTLWGSKEEYWDNHFLISPLNHFLLDPYHWEKKWYYDRPYPMTGGIAEIEAIPLIGPLLDRTVGQLLKPTQIMHSDEWLNPDKGNEKIGFQIAKALGIIEEKIGGAMANGGIAQSVDGLTGGTAYHGVDIMSHVSSGVRTYDEYDINRGPIAYITASGNIRPLRMTEIYDEAPIQSILSKGVSINRVGITEDVSVEEGMIAYEEEIINPASVHSALTDFYYNTSEMAGFYGWVSSLGLKNPMDQYDPKWMTSSKAYGYERAFWDKGYGNLGEDAMEIFRRFVPRDEHKNYINPIDNRMPSWLPDGDYFINFQKGDPYVLVKQGEMRLPGEAYEKLYGIDRDKLMEMSIGGSIIGYDIPEIIDHLLKRDKVKSDAFQEILDKGSELHKEYEKYFDELGIATKVEKEIEDPVHRVKGKYDMMVDTKKIIEWAKANDVEMYYYGATIGDGSEEYAGYYYSPVVVDDQVAQELIGRSPELTTDIKTRGQNQFDKKQLKFENAQQVNFYARHTGTQVNAIIEYNRDDPTAKPRIYMFDYNPYLYDYSMKKVETARGMVRQMIEDGAIGVGDLYSIVDRYRILADVAPYSEEFRNLKKQLSMMDLEEEEKEEIRKINEYIQQQKDPLPTYDYRFKTANVRDVSVTVTKIVDNNTFYTKEFGDHPIRLAGVFVPSGKDEAGQQATEFVRKYLKEGMRIQIAIDADAGAQDLFNDDTYESISAVVRVGNIRNLNRELIERGLAKEKENDYSPAGVHARFSPTEIVIGKAWETFAHLDTPIHCVAPWTEIITDNGIKRADMLKPGDKVLTHEGRFKPVMAVEPQEIGKRIVDIHLKSSNIPLTVTDDHPILAVKHERKKRITSRGTGEKLEPYGRNPVPKFILAGDLEAYDYVVYVPRKMVNENVTPVIDVLQLNPDRFIEKEGRVYTTTGDKYGNLNIKKNGLSLPRFFPVDCNFARLLGYYAAEGCTAKSQGNLTYTVFTFDRDEEEYIQDVCRISEQLFGVTPYIQRKKGTRSVAVRIGCSFLAEMVSKYVGHKTEKRAPQELLINKSLRAEFLRGLLRGGGTKAGYTKYNCIGMVATQILLWVRDALFDLWKIPSSISLGIQRENPLYILYIGKYPELVDFIDGYMEYEEEVFEQPYKNRDKCVVGECIFYRIKSVETSEYQLETIDIEVADDDTFSTINMAVHNTKLLQVRSPLEQYERRDIYGKNFQSWDEPFDDYFIPWYQNWISKSPLAAITLGTAIGSLFGNTRKGKVIGAAIGFLGTSLGVGYRAIFESLSGKAWIPERREKEREIETYMDALKFVKYRKLYEETAKIALKEEGFDVKAFIEGEKEAGDKRQGRLRALMDVKRKLASGDYRAIGEATKYVGWHWTIEGYIKAINEQINEIKNERKAEYIPEIAAQAIAYYQEAETTMYAYDPGDPLDKALKALPHKERIYVKKFMDAPHEERQRILEIAPWYVRRILQSHWGLPVDEKPDLIQLFSKYELPDEQWLGWDSRANLEDIKLKIAKKEGLELSEFNLWAEDEKRARFVDNKHVPEWRQGLNANEVKERLRRILGEAGMENLVIEIEESKKPGVQVNMDIKVDRRKEIIDLMNQNRDSLI